MPKRKPPPKKKPLKVSGIVAAAAQMGVRPSEIRRAKRKGCPAFATNGTINCDVVRDWLMDNPRSKSKTVSKKNPFTPEPNLKSGVAAAWQRIKDNEAILGHAYELLRDDPESDEEERQTALKAWDAAAQMLHTYNKTIASGDRGSEAQIPMSEVITVMRNFLAWMVIGNSNSLHLICPRLEGVCDKLKVAEIVTPVWQSSVIAALQIGASVGKLPDWLMKAAEDQIKMSRGTVL